MPRRNYRLRRFTVPRAPRVLQPESAEDALGHDLVQRPVGSHGRTDGCRLLRRPGA
jgi:hypothetical protein